MCFLIMMEKETTGLFLLKRSNLMATHDHNLKHSKKQVVHMLKALGFGAALQILCHLFQLFCLIPFVSQA